MGVVPVHSVLSCIWGGEGTRANRYLGTGVPPQLLPAAALGNMWLALGTRLINLPCPSDRFPLARPAGLHRPLSCGYSFVLGSSTRPLVPFLPIGPGAPSAPPRLLPGQQTAGCDPEPVEGNPPSGRHRAEIPSWGFLPVQPTWAKYLEAE